MVTFRDITVGLPALLTSLECIIFTFGFYFTFHSSEYQEGTGAPQRRFSGFRALLHAMNPSDLIHGVRIALTTWRIPHFDNQDSGDSHDSVDDPGSVSTVQHAAPKPVRDSVSTIQHPTPKPV